ncbi:MAG: hypothetical protein PHW18_02075 [Sulfuricurvum sp.]|uniref:hypothetical protein n=1 Tax=Sulfuricurvum sp. TaxID=2025608 RepID=UPI0026307385|nr:hypothetical protein [Sulfuricurvum sp.]MDD2828342.1 hypothetical protein [Sulfuricurvum sp.]MDD4949347.1 hypothetical protein [Sulfuricurvum sp.]
MDYKTKHDSKSFLSNDYRSGGKQFSQESLAKRREQEEDFLNQEVDYRNFVFAPEGYEGLMFFIYFLTLPYLVGLGFLFMFVARANYESFLTFNLSSYFIIWAIGYEVSAVLLLIIIFLAWINHYHNRYNREKKRQNNKSRKGY